MTVYADIKLVCKSEDNSNAERLRQKKDMDVTAGDCRLSPLALKGNSKIHSSVLLPTPWNWVSNEVVAATRWEALCYSVGLGWDQ